ncbi:MAG: hypothetical protein H6585_09535 [Flavobacteriales bacterium]|nr:hypothetical protein [Flavobacteriales bacterium]MCB9448571.1 hypothetical protein [Flavobacteriales bacterium]
MSGQEESGFQPEEALKVIHRMVEQTRSDWRSDRFLYLLWGWMVFVSAWTQYMLMVWARVSWHGMVWPVGLGIALIGHTVYLWRRGRRRRARTYVGQFLGHLWTAFGITLFLLLWCVGQKSGGMRWDIVYPVLILMYGMGTYIAGGALRFRPLMVGGISNWVLGVVACFLSFDLQLPLLALAVALSYIAPAYMLKRDHHV